MNAKAAQNEPSLNELKEELNLMKTGSSKGMKPARVKELAQFFLSRDQAEMAKEALQYLPDEKERNLFIADLIEEFLLPAHEFDQAKNFAKFITSEQEIQPLLFIRIALAERNREQACHIAEHLPSPFSRNFAYLQIIEACLLEHDHKMAKEIGKLLLENARTVFDAKSRSHLLRTVAIDLYLANNEKDLAKEAAALIPDESIKALVLKKIG